MTIRKDDLDAVRAFIEKDRAESGAKGGPWFSIKEDGEHEIRIIKLAEFKTGTHWGVIEGKEGKSKSIRCPRVLNSQPCPICERIEELRESDDPEDQERAEKIMAQEKYPIVVLDMQETSPEPRIYEASKSVFYGIWDLIASKSGSYKDLLSLERGRNVIIERDSKKKGKKWIDYKVVPCPDRSEVDVDMEAVDELLGMLQPASYEDIAYALEHGQFPEEAESPKKPKPAAQVKKYQQGLPKTKTRDEVAEEFEEEEELEDIPEPTRVQAATAPKRTGLTAELRNKVAGMSKRN